MSVRAGNTATPDATWTAFAPVSQGTIAGLAGRYLQYRAELATTDPQQAAVLHDVTIGYLTNQFPVAGNDSYETFENAPLHVITPGVLGNDTDAAGGALTAVKVTDPAHGTLTLNVDGSITYTPAANYNGHDSFTYQASDAAGTLSNAATVTIIVNAVNDAPVATDDVAETAEDTAYVFPATGLGSLTANDQDADGDVLTITAVTIPTGSAGSVMLNADGSVTYTPAADFYGPASFTYTVSDGSNTASGTVRMMVTSVNDAPKARNDALTVAEDSGATPIDVLANDTAAPDVDEVLTVTAFTQPANGTVTFSATSISYQPKPNFFGTDRFTYTIADGNGGTNQATITVTVTSVNDAPEAVADTATTQENIAKLFPISGIGSLTANDRDPENDALRVSAVSSATNGSVVLATDGRVTYTPAANFVGTDGFTYTVSDGKGGTATARVTVTVTSASRHLPIRPATAP
jgi:large repetitive protein